MQRVARMDGETRWYRADGGHDEFSIKPHSRTTRCYIGASILHALAGFVMQYIDADFTQQFQ